jgi:hypothetical protein
MDPDCTDISISISVRSISIIRSASSISSTSRTVLAVLVVLVVLVALVALVVLLVVLVVLVALLVLVVLVQFAILAQVSGSCTPPVLESAASLISAFGLYVLALPSLLALMDDLRSSVFRLGYTEEAEKDRVRLCRRSCCNSDKILDPAMSFE